MAKLFLMMGCPGSGKTTWAHKHIGKNDAYISRDDIRFSLIREGDEYFSKENEVFKIFIEKIDAALLTYDNVFADATHLNAASRNKTICNLINKIDEINVIYINSSLEVSIERNSGRTGLKYVPEEVIKRMYKSIQFPVAEEGISKVYIIKDNAPMEIKCLKER